MNTHRWRLIIPVTLIVLALLACGTEIPRGTGSGITPAASPSTATNPTTFNIGDTVQADPWQVVVNAVKTSTGSALTKPQVDNIFLLVDVSLKNTSDQAQDFSSQLSFRLQDTSGQNYQAVSISNVAPLADGRVQAGGRIRGTLSYEIPQTLKQVTLAFTPGFTSSSFAAWDLTVPQ
jgi:hypothetical protein